MKYYEPFQRLDQFVYVKSEKTVYVKSSISVLLPAGTSLIGKDPVRNNALTATLEYIYSVDNSAVESYIFEMARLIKFMDNVPVSDPKLSLDVLKSTVKDLITKVLGKTGYFTVTCIVYKEKNDVGGQVTNNISQQGEVVIL